MTDEKLQQFTEYVGQLQEVLGKAYQIFQEAVNEQIPSKLPTIESVYGKPLSELTLPEGWEWLIEDGKPAFRKGRAGEAGLLPGQFRLPGRRSDFCWVSWETTTPTPRLILRRKAKVRRWVFQQVARVLAGGNVHKGALYLDCGQQVREAEHDFVPWCDVPILHLVEKPE